MALPAAILVGSSLIGAASSLYGAAGARASAKDAKKQAQLQERVAQYQAFQDLTDMARTLEDTLEGQIVAMASRGLGATSPSFRAIMADSVARAAQDANTIRMNALNTNRQIDLESKALQQRSNNQMWSSLSTAFQFGAQGWADWSATKSSGDT